MPLFDPADFLIPAGLVHVCAAGETPVLHAQAMALSRHALDKSTGPAGRAKLDAEVERLRARLAAFWSVETGDIGLVASVAEGMSLLVESLDWRPGDNVLVDRNEYASVVAPLSLRGVELRFVPMAEPEAVAAAADARTRMVAVSAVSYLDARRHDLAALRAAADGVGALLVVDFTQASGWMPIEASIADFAFSACYKWMLGITGTAIAYWNRARQPGWAPATAGWYSIVTGPRPDYAAKLALRPDAGRFTRGNPAHAPCYALHAALDHHERYDRAAVQAHVQALTVALLARLDAAGIPSITPPDPRRHGASVCIAHERASRVVEGMAARGVLAWNGRGRIRISFHGYNTLSQIDPIMCALTAALSD
ncbi:aminotransferase class V-fold PLP-dependent enzyme [Falsiroseomonas selenitidurans]|uniref:Aminotransferase class V-fold PLP-dependent enzyme n=1 Tax=Falsiroseomonas selenitidurans TaxID=2716335 RepID=A0ABX1DZ41_9PROT|nr:aminotransferase class V-fold PLP-dependent enzyme [Falsiroseomonas selenitidurans]NKC29758.1 aminotransferase class V-fold PLP-dependent enzyme [Falsiroseomonas selenitidurans]